MADFLINDSLRFVSRAEWGPDPKLPRLGARVGRDARTHVIVHHTVTPDHDATPNVWEDDGGIFATMRRLQRDRPDLGFDVPYNFVAFAQADRLVICEGRGEDRAGAHTKGHNTAGIAVSFAGNFEDDDIDPTVLKIQITGLSAFLEWLKTSASHPSYGTFDPMVNLGSFRPDGRAVFAHRDFKPTACPGAHLFGELVGVSF